MDEVLKNEDFKSSSVDGVNCGRNLRGKAASSKLHLIQYLPPEPATVFWFRGSDSDANNLLWLLSPYRAGLSIAVHTNGSMNNRKH